MPEVIAALIGAVPATIAAFAAWRTSRQVRVNGHHKKIGELTEVIYEEVLRLRREFDEHLLKHEA